MKFRGPLLLGSVLVTGCALWGPGQREMEAAQRHIVLGDALYANGSFSDSILHYQRSLEFVGDQPLVEVRLGRAYARLDKLELAEKTIRSACLKASPFPECYLELAILLDRRKNFLGALEASSQAAQVLTFPRLDEALRQQAYATANLGRFSESQQLINRALKINPNSCWNKVAKAWIEIESKSFDQPESFLRQARESCASQSLFYEWEAWGLLKVGRRSDAKQVYNRILGSFRNPAVQERARLNIEKIENRISIDRPELF